MRGRYSIFTAVIVGGAVAGLIDLGAASAINGFIDPLRVARFIAAGLLGLSTAKAMGMQSALLGVALQAGMGILIAAIYAVGARFIPLLRRHWLPAGLAFGAGVFVVMNYAVVPLSALHSTPSFTAMSFALNMAAMLLFGVIIAWFARE